MGSPFQSRIGLLLALAALATSAGAATGAGDDRWHFKLEPYLWFPNANLDVKTTVSGLPGPNGSQSRPVDVNAKVEPNDYLSNLKMAVMLLGEARKGKGSVFTDILYVDFKTEDGKVRSISGPLGYRTTDISRKADIDLSTTLWTLAGGYRVAEVPNANLDLFAGFRYLVMNSNLDLTVQDSSGRFYRSNSTSLDQEDWDGIVGARGQLLLNDHWFMPYYADVGAGDSNWTWQGMLGLGYRFDWGDIVLAVRSLSYHFDDNDADLRMTGPAVGVAFQW